MASRTYGCQDEAVSLEAWFPDWNFRAQCIRIKQDVVPAYRGELIDVQHMDDATKQWSSILKKKNARERS